MAPNWKLETNVLHYGSPFQFILMRVELWDKSEVLLGTSCELGDHHENMIGTRKKTKNPFPTPPTLKEKNWTLHECMLSVLIGCLKLLFPKLFVTLFGLG
jgi:hypothetical protein